jgi:hypothetical protein
LAGAPVEEDGIGVFEQARRRRDGPRGADADRTGLPGGPLDRPDQFNDGVERGRVIAIRRSHALALQQRAVVGQGHPGDLRTAQIDADAHAAYSAAEPDHGLPPDSSCRGWGSRVAIPTCDRASV